MNHRFLNGLLRAITTAGLLVMSGNAAALLPFEKTGNLYVSTTRYPPFSFFADSTSRYDTMQVWMVSHS